MEYTHCCDNYMYKCILLRTTSVFKLQKVLGKMSMRFHQTREWKKNRVEEEHT